MPFQILLPQSDPLAVAWQRVRHDQSVLERVLPTHPAYMTPKYDSGRRKMFGFKGSDNHLYLFEFRPPTEERTVVAYTNGGSEAERSRLGSELAALLEEAAK